MLPGSQSQIAPDDLAQPPIIATTTPATPVTPPASEIVVTAAQPDAKLDVIPEGNIPLAPPTPEEVGANPPATTTPPPVTPPPAATLPPPRQRRSWGRRFFWLTVLLGFGYAGSVYYALFNDNFHDFFTEYVPLGESAVSYFEEREFKKRFPDGKSPRMYPQVSGENKVTIAGRSGLQSRVAQEPSGSDLSSRGPHTSAVRPVAPKTQDSSTSQPKEALSAPSSGSPMKVSESGMTSKSAEPAKASTVSSIGEPNARAAAPRSATPAPRSATSAPISTGVAPSIELLDHMNIENASDPVVQEITKMLNDLITVVNADNAQDKYSTTLEKAKQDVQKVARDLAIFRTTQVSSAEEKLKQQEIQFDEGAKELIKKFKQDQENQEMHWRQEYEAERERLAKSYEEKVRAEIEAVKHVNEQNLHNALLDQEIKLKEHFTGQVRDRVETERSGRLSKLGELSSEVAELESLTAKWNEVVDSNLKTQHLNVAVDAVKSVLESADRPRPFLHELVALKEIASDDPVVNAAIASINPAAYQRGVPTIAQLVDRFRRVAGEVRKAALLPEDAGVASHAASFLLSKVMFKKSGITEGSDVESILTRAETFLEEGELDEAAREMNGLQGWAKVLSRDWLAEARRVLEVKQALDVSTLIH